MEPSSAEDGNAGQTQAPEHVANASMEPSSAEDGNPDSLRCPKGLNCVASMEPSSAEDGNISSPLAPACQYGRFNGAVLS